MLGNMMSIRELLRQHHMIIQIWQSKRAVAIYYREIARLISFQWMHLKKILIAEVMVLVMKYVVFCKNLIIILRGFTTLKKYKLFVLTTGLRDAMDIYKTLRPFLLEAAM